MLRMTTFDRAWAYIEWDVIADKRDRMHKQMYFSRRHRREYEKHDINTYRRSCKIKIVDNARTHIYKLQFEIHANYSLRLNAFESRTPYSKIMEPHIRACNGTHSQTPHVWCTHQPKPTPPTVYKFNRSLSGGLELMWKAFPVKRDLRFSQR